VARQESDREDLLAEATALVRRAELQIPGEAEPITAGFRRSGFCSIYFGGDPVFHFNETGQLRRAFAEGFLLRTQGSTLSRMHRVRTETQTILSRHDFEKQELEEFLESMQQRLTNLAECIRNGEAEILRQVPADAEFFPELLTFLERIRDVQIPLASAIKGKP
jgi:hypothetical protein